MKITMEFSNAEEFFTQLPEFAKAVGLAGQFVHFTHVSRDDKRVMIQSDAPDVRVDQTIKEDGRTEYVPYGAEDAVKKVTEAARKAAADAPAPENKKPETQDAPKESDGKSSTETTKAPEKKKTGASVKPENVIPKPVDPSKGTPDIAAVRKVLHAAIKAGHKDEMKALLSKLGAQNVSTLDPSKYTEFITEANKIGGGDNA